MTPRGEALPSAHGASSPVPVLLGLAGLIVPAWAYLLYMGWGMAHMDVGAQMLLMPRMTGWGPVDLILVFVMWAVMMAAMMLPTALPMVLAFRSLRQRSDPGRAGRHVAVFISGYLVIWIGFSIVATLGQWALLLANWVSPMMELGSPLLGGGLLLAAGLFQLTPLKKRCLSHCRSPLSFLMTAWRPGARGAWAMGLRHGLWCTGCCWLMMALLFLLGVMNVAWIAALTVFAVLEKTWPIRWPGAHWISPGAGLLLIIWGGWLLHGALALGRAGSA